MHERPQKPQIARLVTDKPINEMSYEERSTLVDFLEVTASCIINEAAGMDDTIYYCWHFSES
jgi:hypothetical protein